ncbi:MULTISPECIES: cell division protein FtsQ/DivIB [Methylobacterium]|jgi:cell division protein FtsQ|uniref:Cell division protein FtsQ n=1 Tax=Methylobacterium radiotolerans (strain ATCC 27329 / DSM 1819 / JCM 2831 / NBRC 15690 / NCIMB 10815 / 0-1) TaxID=426355 RepID=B1LXZ0_METRJ|nr:MULTISPECIES: cell division protein FtsQ/DivIB [Methylobacterium]GAN49376.1 polypeptide-transport-associated domain-containing protein [Methylobacterium sp. ME121]ACB24347.1 Polypeptide-transport-associated domain protein FtsQ-type [Methylobacterium radiotolerans JCM 2831]MBN6820756.1 cell division protein FtsQ/DivIB [Methylobacterium organophilum]ONF50301.1 peptide transporter [Methylobacterium radiotolerans]OXE41837.1 peptide transporter [Methylobacterium radiotolerans]
MDGGGRFPESLSGDAAGRSGPARLAGAILGRLAGRATSRSLSVRRARPSQRLSERLPRGAGIVAVAVSAAAVALAGFVASGRYDAFVAEQGRPLDIAARVAGFGVERVTISGISRMYEREVLAAAGIDWRSSVPFLDVNDVRERLLRVPLIAQASVRKIYPNEIAITQVEREPAALWQKNGEINVIAADGTVIDAMRDDRYASLPLVVGEDANTKLPEYLALIAAAGPLAERIKAGTYVSGRRWTLKFDGIDVRLPEADPAAALARLVRFEREAHLLEKDIIAVDLRMPDRLVVRLTEEAAAARAEAQKAKKKGAAS